MKRFFLLLSLIPMFLPIANAPHLVNATGTNPVIECSALGMSLAGIGIGGYDPNGLTLHAEISWGDATTQTITISNALGPGQICDTSANWISPPTFGTNTSHQYPSSGSYHITACLVDSGGLKSCLNEDIQITASGGILGSKAPIPT